MNLGTDKFRRYKTRTNKYRFICVPYLVPVIGHVGSEKIVLFTRLNANFERVFHPIEIAV